MSPGTRGAFDDRLLDTAVRAAESQSFVGHRHLTPRQRWIGLGVLAVVLAVIVGLVVHARQPDPFTVTRSVVWSHPVVNGRDVTVSYSYGNCAPTSVRVETVETARQVVLTVVLVEQYADGGPCADVAMHGKAVAVLARPLGARELVDGTAS